MLVANLEDAVLEYWVEEDEQHYEIVYAMDHPRMHYYYGKPYFEKE